MPLVRQMYEAGGAKAIGRKIGFTNRTIWAQYGVYAPIWGHVFDRTVHDLAAIEALPLALFSEPRIEPEIVFGLAAAPSPQMDEVGVIVLHRLGRARLRDRAVDLSGMEIFRGRHHCRQRRARRAIDRTAPSVRAARGGMAEDAFVVRNRSELRRPAGRPRTRRKRAGRPALGAASPRWPAGDRSAQSAARGRRDRQHRHA